MIKKEIAITLILAVIILSSYSPPGRSASATAGNAANSTSTVPLLCQGVTTICADFYAMPGPSQLTSVFTAVANSQTASFNWNFSDGKTGAGSPVTHTFSQGEYLVSLNVTDGSNTFSVSHDVSEVASLPAYPFVTPSSSSWNPGVSCQASITTISGIIGTVQNGNGGADLSGALTTSMLMKHTLIRPCSMFGFSVFVELHAVGIISGPSSTTDCTSYPSVGSFCDTVGNLADGPGDMHQIRWEMERQWQASGMLSQYSTPQIGQVLDVQGYMFWSFIAPADAQHNFSGWYLELSAWRPSSSASQPMSTGFSFSPTSPDVSGPVSFYATATGASPYNFSWIFGDGKIGTGASITHSYAVAGNYNVTLTTTDSAGQTAYNSQSITVLPAQPSATPAYGPWLIWSAVGLGILMFSIAAMIGRRRKRRSGGLNFSSP